MSKRLKAAIASLKEADQQVARILREDYPEGAPIAWRRAANIHYGIVVMNCYYDRVKVRNNSTGKELFISASSIETR